MWTFFSALIETMHQKAVKLMVLGKLNEKLALAFLELYNLQPHVNRQPLLHNRGITVG